MFYSIPDCALTAMILGLCFGLVYEALRIVRKLLSLTAVTVICDITFFVVSAFAVFMLSETLGNNVRIYTILGYGAGVFVYINTLGRLLNRAETALISAVRSIFRAVSRFFGRVFRPVFGSIAHISHRGLVTIHDFFGKAQKNRKRDLKNAPEECYNDVYIRKTSGENNHVIKAQVRKGAGRQA